MIKVLWYAPDPVVLSGLEFGRPSDIYVLPVRTRAELFSYLANSIYNVVIGSLPLPEMQPEEFLDEVRRIDGTLPVVLWQSTPSMDEAIRLTKLGAHHVLGPGAGAGLHETIREAARYTRASARQDADEEEPWRKFLIGESKAMHRVTEVIRLIAARRSTVLITGETGTGKELVARAIHMASGRGQVAMVSVNCSAIPPNLLEAELFGHSKGAFTGATQSRTGRFEQAHGSTIFLDEIGDLPLELQTKLLRVLQEKEIQRLGSSETIKLNLRVIAATNVDLDEAVQEKRFRQDLFYRLSVVPLRLPALRERKEDIPLLVQHFIEKVCRAESIPLKYASSETVRQLADCDWPGNVRQLEHTVEMAVVMSGDRAALFPSDFQIAKPARQLETGRIAVPFIHVPDEGLDFDDTVGQLERSILEQALVKSGGNKARAAELLRMKRTTLLAKMKAFHAGTAAGNMARTACA